MFERKLYKTKLCILYQRGRCPRESCSFAHGDAELRRLSGSFNGRRDHLGSDLRDNLDRRDSPQRRHSPRRDARGHQTFRTQKRAPYSRGYSPSRSPTERSKKRNGKRQHIDGRSDISGSLEVSDGAEDRVKEGRQTSYKSKNVLEEKLKLVQLDIDTLNESKSQLEICLEERVQEADSLTSRIDELESQLSREQEDCKRTTSKIKKFIKAHNRFLRAQEELKRSQARLQRLADQLGPDASGPGASEEDLSINIISEGEPNDNNGTSMRNEAQNHASLSRKRSRIQKGASEDSKQANTRKDGGLLGRNARLEKFTWLDGSLAHSNNDKEADLVKKVSAGNNGYKYVTNDDKQRRGKIGSPIIAHADKVKVSESEHMLPSTGMAAHAVDEIMEASELEEKIEVVEAAAIPYERGTAGLPLPPPPPLRPPPIASVNTYKQYEGDDETVDVEALDVDMRDIDLNTVVDIEQL